MTSAKSMKLELHAEFPYEEESEHAGLGSTRLVGYAVKGTPFRVSLRLVTKSKVSLSQAQVQMQLLTEETYAPVEIGEMPIKFEATTTGSVIYCDTRLFVLSTQLAKSCVVIKAIVTVDGHKPMEVMSCPIKVVSKPEQIRKKRKEANQEPELEGSKKRARSEDVLVKLRSLYGSAVETMAAMKRQREAQEEMMMNVSESETSSFSRPQACRGTKLRRLTHQGVVVDNRGIDVAVEGEEEDEERMLDEEEEESWMEGINQMHTDGEETSMMDEDEFGGASDAGDEEEEEERSTVSHFSAADTTASFSDASTVADHHHHHHDHDDDASNIHHILQSFESILTTYDALSRIQKEDNSSSRHADEPSTRIITGTPSHNTRRSKAALIRQSQRQQEQEQEKKKLMIPDLSLNHTLFPAPNNPPAPANAAALEAADELASVPMERWRAALNFLGVVPPSHSLPSSSAPFSDYP